LGHFGTNTDIELKEDKKRKKLSKKQVFNFNIRIVISNERQVGYRSKSQTDSQRERNI